MATRFFLQEEFSLGGHGIAMTGARLKSATEMALQKAIFKIVFLTIICFKCNKSNRINFIFYKIQFLILCNRIDKIFIIFKMNVKEIFGTNLRNFRKKHKYTQEKLAELVEITPQHLGVIERGDAFVSAELLEKFSKTLDIPLSTFFYSETENSGSDTFLKKIDSVIEKELTAATKRIKNAIRN